MAYSFLGERSQATIRENQDLGEHLADAVNSLRIVLAADRAAREGRTIDL